MVAASSAAKPSRVECAALLTSTVGCPTSSVTASISRSGATASDRSVVNAVPGRSSGAASPGVTVKATVAPRPASARTHAAPIPRGFPAPVTRAIIRRSG